MSSVVERLLGVAPLYVYLVVGILVFLEDAVFVGFVLPAEIAVVVGGVSASQGRTDVVVLCVVVVVAAIVGDSVGYEVGKKLGPRLLRMRILASRLDQLDRARGFLARRGGSAVFLGRFTAFFRAVMPALAGIAEMPYRRFLPWNAVGGIVWGVAFTLLGYFAGNSYQAVASKVGTGVAVVIATIVVVALVVWQVRKHRAERA